MVKVGHGMSNDDIVVDDKVMEVKNGLGEKRGRSSRAQSYNYYYKT